MVLQTVDLYSRLFLVSGSNGSRRDYSHAWAAQVTQLTRDRSTPLFLAYRLPSSS
jgi:hypothetical protein